MTPKEQVIAIAKTQGWANVRVEPHREHRLKSYSDAVVGDNPSGYFMEVPDYLKDLNAMHEVEKSLLKIDSVCGHWETYSNQLTTMLGCTDIFHATAAQRAEAYLRTLNLWKP